MNKKGLVFVKLYCIGEQTRYECVWIGLNANVLLDGFFESVWIGARECIDLFAVLQENECWHAGNVESNGKLFTIININLFFVIRQRDKFQTQKKRERKTEKKISEI